jgi:uncharacterized protein
VEDGPAGAHAIDCIAHLPIELSDGCRLSARVWLPRDAHDAPVPAVLEYLPYRKDDRTAWQDSTRHPYFAQHGFASVRVDLRGTGSSDGMLCDEYLETEQRDAIEVIEWLARQPWCSGSVGMIGYSWGGFNGLQIASKRPAALKAVVSLYSTDDRYQDDCHYIGGAVMAGDMLRWAQAMRAITALPPDPAVVGERWRAMWRERLEVTPHFVEAWLSHQRRDDYWKHGSIAECYGNIEAATLIVGGWADAYTNAVPRMIEHLQCPRAAIIGPWAHIFPERGVPGPAIGFLQECVTWFDRWLRGVENAADTWPLMRVWMQEPVGPAPFYALREGRWLGFDRWPSPQVATELWSTAGGVLGGQAPSTDERAATEAVMVSVAAEQSLGETAGVWCANGRLDEMPVDQRLDDERSLTFDSVPLEDRIEILGRPVVCATVSVDRPSAHLIARLCDVSPDGTSTLISYGVLNLAHRDSDENPGDVPVDHPLTVRLALNIVGQAVEAGHRLRLALSSAYWPMVWPTPEPVTLSVLPDASLLELPLLRDGGGSSRPVMFGPPEGAEPLAVSEKRAERTRDVVHEAGVTRTRERELAEVVHAESGTRILEEQHGEWTIRSDDPLSACYVCERDHRIERDAWRVRVIAAAEMTASETHYLVAEKLTAYDGDDVFFRLARGYRIERDHT